MTHVRDWRTALIEAHPGLFHPPGGHPEQASGYPEYDLRLAQVASILLIAGTEQSLRRFTATHMTFMVEDIEAFAAHLPTVGATILEAPKPVPTGRNMLARHPDQTLVEYVEHNDKHPADVLSSASR